MNKRATSWEDLSNWYSGMVGERGSIFHQKTVIPTILDLIDFKKKPKVLEIGSGTGLLSKYIKTAGGLYSGVESSNSLHNVAKKQFGKYGNFYLGDAARLNQVKELHFSSFDYVVFMLSIQDMNPLDKVLYDACKFLKVGGEMIIFMTHPAFRLPRLSGWIDDEKRGLLSRRMDRYLTDFAIPLETKVKNRGNFVKSYHYHRPISMYINELSKNKVFTTDFIEIPTYKVGEKGLYNKKEKNANQEFPLFLAIKAIKNS